MARARVRAAFVARDGALGPRLLEFLRETAAALWHGYRHCSSVVGACWPQARALLMAAARLRLDPISRLSSSARRNLPGAMEGCGAWASRPLRSLLCARGRVGRGPP